MLESKDKDTLLEMAKALGVIAPIAPTEDSAPPVVSEEG